MMEQGPEPWLRGTLTDIDPLRRQVMHALELAAEDAQRWCEDLSTEQRNARPAGVAPVAFHLRHIARSLDRLLTYADGRRLTTAQRDALHSELHPSETPLTECLAGIDDAMRRVRAFTPELYDEPRGVGEKLLPTTVAGLLIHCAEHTQRHIGQAITTAKIVRGAAPQAASNVR